MNVRTVKLASGPARRLTPRQAGLSLVELMIAMVLGLFLIAGALTVYAETKRTYRYHDGLAQIQEQTRFSVFFLTRNVRVAGFPGDNAPPGNRIEGTDGVTDTLTVRVRDELDCRDEPTGGVAINRFRINAGNLECSGDGVTWDVYVTNVEDMQFAYGEDLNGDGSANRYVTASDGPNWGDVVAIRASLLIRSADFATSEPESYRSLGGAVVVPADRRIRRSAETTIALRN